MSEYTLTPAPPLVGANMTIGEVRLRVPVGLAIVSLALPLGDEAEAAKAVQVAWGKALPEVGQSVTAKDGVRLVRLGQDQAFVIFPHTPPDAAQVVAARLNGRTYVTDQTDAWAVLEMGGPQSRTALERICPLDLHPKVFAIDAAARTVMEHLGVLIIRTGGDAFLLLSASSSADSFLHAVQTSMQNVETIR